MKCMDAVVYLDRRGEDGPGFYVSLRVDSIEVEIAGPWDDVEDAIFMAERTVYGGGTVEVHDSVGRAGQLADGTRSALMKRFSGGQRD